MWCDSLQRLDHKFIFINIYTGHSVFYQNLFYVLPSNYCPQVHVTEPDVHIPMDWSHLSDLQENVEKMAASVAAKVNDSIFVDSPQTWPGVWGCKIREGRVQCRTL